MTNKTAEKLCINCQESLPLDAFRQRKQQCTWCEYNSMEKRAVARYKDKMRTAGNRLAISQEQFVSWYVEQPDECHYCGTTRDEFKRLRAKRSFGYFVSWDIDRQDSNLPYTLGNLVLSCFMCNMAKSSYFTSSEAKLLGFSIRKIVVARLDLTTSKQ